MIKETMPLQENSFIGYSGPKLMNIEIIRLLNLEGLKEDRYSKF